MRIVKQDQITELPFVVSSAALEEALLSPDAVKCIGLGIENWVNMIEQNQQIYQERIEKVALARTAGFDMVQETKKLGRYYEESLEVLRK